MLAIGEFSRVTRITVKALRLYHEKGLLIPDHIDRRSRYRYYSQKAVRKAALIRQLKEMGFSLDEIRDTLLSCSDDQQMVERVKRKLAETRSIIVRHRQVENRLELFLRATAAQSVAAQPGITREDIPECRICSVRFTGRYEDVGEKFKLLFKVCGFHATGRGFSLYYDGEYREDGADIEACVQVKREIDPDGVTSRILAGGPAVTALHRGPYSDLGGTYQRLFSHCREQGMRFKLPIREEYVKGPGLIFRGNPQKYLTRLILLLDI